MSVNFDPIWPWSKLDSAQIGSGVMGQFLFVLLIALLVLLPLIVIVLSLGSYVVGTQNTWRRTAAIVLLRLGACVLVFIAVLRPSLGFDDPADKRGVLLVAIDASESMSILDELDNQSRWDYLQRVLKDNAPAFKKLADEKKIDVVFYRFAGDAAEAKVDELGKPDGKRTDFGTMLRTIYDARNGQQPLLGLLVLSDGADNGTKIPALTEAGRWRKHPCPIHTFALGKPTTSDRQQDLAITGITTSPSPQVPVKAELRAKIMVDAPGFENRKVRVRMFLDDKEVQAQNATLALTINNEVEIKCTAPAKAGEVKVTVKIDPLQGEVNPNNNSIDTYVTVTQEGISVLLVDKPRAGEPQMICDALAEESRIRLYPVWLRRDEAPSGSGDGLFQFDKQQYDVIIIGDVTARQMLAGNRNALTEIRRLVEKGSGFMMLGGYRTFANGDWKGTEIADLLPVELDVQGQSENTTHMYPNPDGVAEFKYFMQLAEKKEDDARAWNNLHELDGTTLLGKPKPGVAKIVAVTTTGKPLLAAGRYGEGRTLAFGGDTTHRWIRNPETKQMHHQFWRRLVIWLARQDEMEGSVRVIPDTRRLPLHNDLGFRVEMRSKGNVPIENGEYKVEVFGPNDLHKTVTTVRKDKVNRGTFVNTDVPGEYRIEVSGEGKDASGDTVSDKASARFMVYDDDLEMTRRAADHEFLKKLSAAGGGEFHLAKDLGPFLQQFQKQPLDKNRSPAQQWPNWRTTKLSPFFVLFFLIFVAVLSGEWLLRRRWGMV
jgi:uncharacterized membrane protein